VVSVGNQKIRKPENQNNQQRRISEGESENQKNQLGKVNEPE
jgi:hypothetical protein